MPPSFKLSESIQKMFVDSNSYVSFNNINKFLKWFLLTFDKRYEKYSNITFNIFDIQEENIPIKKENNINVLLCYENCYAYNHYNHFNKYGDFGDKNIDIYIYNHINDIVIQDDYIAIPFIYIRNMFFQNFYKEFKPLIMKNFNERKFCILLTPNFRNMDIKKKLLNSLNTIDKCYVISQFGLKIKNLSIYSEYFLNFVNHFKFCIVCENSRGNGYITEKIFNCFYSRSIPIYWGTNPEEYFNNECYIDAREDINSIINKVKLLNNDEILYNEIINNDKLKNNIKIKTEENITSMFDFIDKKNKL